jgi:ribose 5-phosphate isomerase B
MNIAIGADHGGFKLKQKLVSFLRDKGHRVTDFGTFSEESCDYPLISYEIAKQISESRCERAILICKSGIGSSIVANKTKGVRAALCRDIKCARLSRQHNDANVLVLAANFTRCDLAKRIVGTWLKTEFSGAGRHLRRVKQIKDIEKREFR